MIRDANHATEKRRARDRDRSRRKLKTRNKVLQASRITQYSLALGAFEYPEDVALLRPKTRAECERGVRPCPFVACRHHLYLDVNANGSIKLNFPNVEPHELRHSCALDVADEGGISSENIGSLINLTRERVRQIALAAVEKILPSISECFGVELTSPKKRLPLFNRRARNEEFFQFNGDQL